MFSFIFLGIVLAITNGENQYGTVIGIDLGTTYSCVGVMKSGQIEIIANEQGNRITPSYVAFTSEGSRLIGDSAKNQLTTNHKNTVFDVKRFIGRTWNDEVLQKDLKHFPFDVVDKDNRPFIKVNFKDTDKLFAPEEISAMILTKMKDIAENYLGVSVTHAVVTVPAYFNDAQRQATKTAGKIAGLNILRIINEPTAAAIAYGLDKKVKHAAGKSKEKQILVFDLGGGTFDVSLLAIDEEVFEVVSTSGDTHLGGEDFDQNVIDYFIKMIQKKKGKNISSNQRAIQKLRREVEKAKRSLSSVLSTRIEIESLYDGEDFSETLTRAKFEELNNDLFMSTLKPVEKVIQDGKINKEDIDEIVLVGGSTRIPKIQKIVKEFFNKEPHTGINPDEAIAYGAAIQGSVLSGDKATSDLLLLDVCPLTLGMELENGFMAKLIPRNTPIPTIKKDTFTTVVDNQESVVTAIYEGERPLVKDNHFLGKFTLTGIPPAPRNMPQIEVTFEIDANGILKVTAESKESGSKQHIVIQNNKDRLNDEEIERMIKESEQFKEQDNQIEDRNKAKSSLEQFVYSTRSQLTSKSFTKNAPEDAINGYSDKLAAVIKWLDKVSIDNTDKKEFVDRQKSLEEDLEKLLTTKRRDEL